MAAVPNFTRIDSPAVFNSLCDSRGVATFCGGFSLLEFPALFLRYVLRFAASSLA
jgi:hypothetical protein